MLYGVIGTTIPWKRLDSDHSTCKRIAGECTGSPGFFMFIVVAFPRARTTDLAIHACGLHVAAEQRRSGKGTAGKMRRYDGGGSTAARVILRSAHAVRRVGHVDSVLAATLIRRRMSPRHGGGQRPYNDRSTCMRIPGECTGSTDTAGLRACESRASAQAARAQQGGYGDMLVAEAQRCK
jgi:hypothetical protein